MWLASATPGRARRIEGGFELEAVLERGGGILAFLGRRRAEVLCRPFGPLGMQGHDLEGRREALFRRVLRVVGAALPLRIEADRRAPDLDPGAEIGVPARGADDRHDPVDHLGVGDRPLIGLERAHGRPTTALSLRMPRLSKSAFWTLTKSRIETTGKLRP